jgi:hypothetical protein
MNFYDLTGIFIKRRETLYVDKCCRFSQRELSIMADKIVEAIIASP